MCLNADCVQPCCWTLYLLSNIDRSNIGYAQD